jgi:putative intracellular protease/amidase
MNRRRLAEQAKLISIKACWRPLTYSNSGNHPLQEGPERQSRAREHQGVVQHPSGDYDAVFYPGGHGPLWDLANDANSIALIETMFGSGHPVALVCHGPGALRYATTSDGKPLVAGKSVTGFSNTEEAAVGLTQVVPFLVEDMLRNNGGKQKGNWQPYAVAGSDLITGQNLASSAHRAEGGCVCKSLLRCRQAGRSAARKAFRDVVLVRKFAVKLFDREEREAANWPLIADTLFKAAFDALDRSPDDASRAAFLRRVNAGSYDRLNASPDGPK